MIRPDFSSPSLSESESEDCDIRITKYVPPKRKAPSPNRRKSAKKQRKMDYDNIIDLTSDHEGDIHKKELEFIDLTNDDDVQAMLQNNTQQIHKVMQAMKKTKTNVSYNEIKYQKRIQVLCIALIQVMQQYLQKLHPPRKGPKILIVSPRRHSAVDLHCLINQLVRVSSSLMTGGRVSQSLYPSITIATPGKLLSMLRCANSKVSLHNVDCMVMESSNEFFSSDSLRAQMSDVTGYLGDKRPMKVVWCDTIETDDDSKGNQEIEYINAETNAETIKNGNHFVFYCKDNELQKTEHLRKIILYYCKDNEFTKNGTFMKDKELQKTKQPKLSMLVYFGYKVQLNRVFEGFGNEYKLKFNIKRIHGEFHINERERILNEYRLNGGILFASNVIAGSIPSFSHVIVNYSFSFHGTTKRYIDRMASAKTDSDIYTMVTKNGRFISIEQHILKQMKDLYSIGICCCNEWMETINDQHASSDHSVLIID